MASVELTTASTRDDLAATIQAHPDECECLYDGPLDAIDELLGLRDWAVYDAEDGRALFHGSTTRFLPLKIGKTLVKRKPDRYLIYVLCPTQADVRAARETFREHPWAVPIVIPTTFYLESVMYFHVLPHRRAEWEHAEYVGTIAHSAPRKLRSAESIPAILDVLKNGSEKHSDVVAFMMRTLPLIQVAEAWHPGFLDAWVPALKHHGFPPDKIVSPDIVPFYCNYWAATPATMDTYIAFFSSFRMTLDTLPGVYEAIWKDSGYHRAHPDAGRMTRDRCEEIWGTRHYPFHPFVCERLPCFFFWAVGTSVLAAPL
jgi:hypothetical protein